MVVISHVQHNKTTLVLLLNLLFDGPTATTCCLFQMSRPLPAPQPSTKRAGPTNTSTATLPPRSAAPNERTAGLASSGGSSSAPLNRSANVASPQSGPVSPAAPVPSIRDQMNSSTGNISTPQGANSVDLWKVTQLDVDNTLEHISDGYHVLDRSQKLMRRIIQLHGALAKDIRSLVEYEREKLPALSAKPSMDTLLLSSWSGFLDISMGLAEGYDKFASIGANHVYNPISDQFENAKLLVKDAEIQTKAVYGSIEKISSLVDKSHAKTVKSLQQFQGKVNLKNPIPKGDVKKCKVELQTYQKILDILEAHQTTVDSCNEAVADITKDTLPQMIGAIQQADQKRLEITNNALIHYSTTMHVLAELGANNDKRTKDFAEAVPKQKSSLDNALQNISSAFSGGVKKSANAKGSPSPMLFSFAIPVDKTAVEERVRLLQVESGEVPLNPAMMIAAVGPSPDEYKAEDVCFFSHGRIDELLRFESVCSSGSLYLTSI
jgi:hypothetical protein